MKHVRATSWIEYEPKRYEIVELYNNSQDVHFEQPGINKLVIDDLSCLHCFYKDGVKGDVLVEQLLGNECCAIITFAAIEGSQRRKGIGSSLVSFATKEMRKNDIELIGVQLNTFDDQSFWNKFFSVPVSFGNGMALLTTSYANRLF